MSDINKQNLNGKAVPFFARYLEGQGYEELSEKEVESIRGGYCHIKQTRKAPSDNEEIIATTMKYPSDNEEGGGGGLIVTLKAPSDSDEALGNFQNWYNLS